MRSPFVNAASAGTSSVHSAWNFMRLVSVVALGASISPRSAESRASTGRCRRSCRSSRTVSPSSSTAATTHTATHTATRPLRAVPIVSPRPAGTTPVRLLRLLHPLQLLPKTGADHLPAELAHPAALEALSVALGTVWGVGQI